jgi:hypothetical protein
MVKLLVAAFVIFIIWSVLSSMGTVGGPSLFGGGGASNGSSVTGGFSNSFGVFQQKNANALSR